MGHQKFIYNAKVHEQDYWHRFSNQSLALTCTSPSTDQHYSYFKTELTPWLSQVHSQILRNGVNRFTCANARFHKGLGGAPTIKKKFSRKSVLITGELFEYRERANQRPKNDGTAPFDLTIGTPKFPVGKLKVTTSSRISVALGFQVLGKHLQICPSGTCTSWVDRCSKV